MIFRQLLHRPTSSFTYLFARRAGGEAAIVDPVASEIDTYLVLARQLEVRIGHAFATHAHQGEVPLAALRDRTGCETIMGRASEVAGLTRRLDDGEWLEVDRMMIQAFLTPGHTPDSACFAMNDRAFTGDTLLLRSTGRTDLDGGDAEAQYHSLWDKILWLADHVLVYPTHDYKGWTSSTIAEERAYNPRLQVRSAERYAALMSQLELGDPSLMDDPRPAEPPYGLAPP